MFQLTEYGEVVRVLTMTSDSVELCGGTHARALGDIGLFKIVSEGGVAAGVRRLFGATGLNALTYVREAEGELLRARQAVKAGHEVMLSFARDQTKLDKIASELGVTPETPDAPSSHPGGGGSGDSLVLSRTATSTCREW